MQKDFITVTPDSGGGNGTISVLASKNTGGTRATMLIISGNGVSKGVPIIQQISITPRIGAMTFVPSNIGWKTTFDGVWVRPPYNFPITVGSTFDLVYPRSLHEDAHALIAFDAAVISSIERIDSVPLVTDSYTESQFQIVISGSNTGIYDSNPVIININFKNGNVLNFKYWELYRR